MGRFIISGAKFYDTDSEKSYNCSELLPVVNNLSKENQKFKEENEKFRNLLNESKQFLGNIEDKSVLERLYFDKKLEKVTKL